MPARNNPKAFADWYEQDYFRRRRRPWLLTAAILAAMGAAAAGIAATFVWPHGRTAYQAGPLSSPHAFLVNNCEACHTEPFATARRLLPANADIRSASDAACLTCHAAGAHSPVSTQFLGVNRMSGSCAACHREHRGGETIAKLEDTHCTRCHQNLQSSDGEHRFSEKITHFDSDHPEFGRWRGGPPRDPGTLKFNHKVHMDLAKSFETSPDGRNAWMAAAAKRLHDLSCTACHEPDDERKYIRPVRFEAHCGECHPITAPVGDPPAKLRHPQRGQTAAVVRAELLERFWKQIAGEQKPPAAAADTERPAPLNRSLPPLTANQRERVKELGRQAEGKLFATDPLAGLERPQFQMASGCAYCHEEATTPETRPDGLPTYKLPGLRGRWNDVPFPHERFGELATRSAAAQTARDRWFPYAKFSHESHRLLDCQSCHAGAAESIKTADVLMPGIDACKQCHNRKTVGVRSDCLECHQYHDRGAEPTGLHGRLKVEEVLDMTRPGAAPRGR